MKKLDQWLIALLNPFFKMVAKLIGRNFGQEKMLVLGQFIKFGVVGLSNTLLSYVIYLLAWKGLGTLGFQSTTRYLLAQVLAFILGVLWSFYWNNKVVFTGSTSARRRWVVLMKTFLSYSFTGLFLNSFLLMLWVQVFQISELVAPLLNLVISVPLNFLLNKYWAFK